MSVPEMVMLVGLPASGKSTWASKMQEKGYIVHSSDAIREEIYHDAAVQVDPSHVFNVLTERVHEDLRMGRSCIYDATNVSRRRRMDFLRTLDSIPCTKRCMVFVTPFPVVNRRNMERSRVVPLQALKRMLRCYECPQYFEGWDRIDPVYCNEIYRFPMLDMENFSQDNPHHSMTLGIHMQLAAAYITTHKGGPLLRQAALYHDCGKPFTKSFVNSRGAVDNIAHYFGHENAGAYIYLTAICSGGICREKKWEDALYVAGLINMHMRPLNAWRSSVDAQRRDRKLIGEKMYSDLLLLNKADLSAH